MSQESDNPGTPQSRPSLADTMLAQPIGDDRQSSRRWAYPRWAMFVVAPLIAYHAAILIVTNTPAKGLSRGLHQWFNNHLQMSRYLRTIGGTQSWAMFAPNPHRSNMFMKVLVEDQDGEVWDLKHDIYGKRTYPYMFYSRMGKINRRIIETKGYRRHYAAWVCRDWEAEHEGVRPVEVRFVKMWTRVPPPQKAYKFMYFDPMDLQLHQVEEDTFKCESLQHGQLPNYLRERLGLQPVPEGEFRDIRIQSWWDRAEAKQRAEERRLEAEMRRQEMEPPSPPAGERGAEGELEVVEPPMLEPLDRGVEGEPDSATPEAKTP